MFRETFRLHRTTAPSHSLHFQPHNENHQAMLSLKLLRQTLSDPLLLLPNHHHHPPAAAANNSDEQPTQSNLRSDKILTLLFIPTNEVVVDTYRLASIARDIGLNLYPTPSLSHIVFTAPSSQTTSSHASISSFSSSLCLQNDAVALPFPSLSSASAAHLRAFVSLSNGNFNLIALSMKRRLFVDTESNWESCGMRLLCTRSGAKIATMDEFSVAMAGAGWTLFKTSPKSTVQEEEDDGFGRCSEVYLYRKVEANRLLVEVREGGGEGGRVRELRLPLMDFKNVPLRILQYILLMTDDVFYMS